MPPLTTNMARVQLWVSALDSLIPEYESALHSFISSPSKFRLVTSVNPTKMPPKTLYILDSSFNPPTKAHLALATSALASPAPSDEKPHRLLLLFSTFNADKAPSPASFAQRLALMRSFTEDLLANLQEAPASPVNPSEITVDIGLTKEPYYTDKSTAIMNEPGPPYPSNPKHVHLLGYDTLIRFCNPKYYPNHNPPLSALTPFFHTGHKLRVTQRPCDKNDKSSAEFGTVEEQEKYLQMLRDGEFEEAGFERAWADCIDMVKGEEGLGISSTRVRTAAKEGDWEVLGQLCTERVAACVEAMGCYGEEVSGKKIVIG
ncbi:Nucleotidylyl transferase [Lojkania enalia]|uniref:Nucleotidylyl transferase n=1 Tax=Lojkania enalia TaxID=147567 RepID=A0A9P4K1Z2_9PLEO|nr:Nucleotidylyl transferase [Didymosphaeria enalia]